MTTALTTYSTPHALLLQPCAQRLADAEALAQRAHEEYSDWLGALLPYTVPHALGHLWLQTGCVRGCRLGTYGCRRALADDAGRAQLPLRRCRGAGARI